MIKAIVFDFDGVTYLENPRFGFVLSKKFNIPYDQVLPFFENELPECQISKKDLKEELVKYIKKWHINSTTEQIMKMWFENGGINQQIIDIIKTLKNKEYTTALITSNEKYRIEYMKRKYGLTELFDEIIPSYEVGARKPDLKFYNAMIKRLNVNPEEILIIDDKSEFSAITDKLGIKSIVYKSIDTLKSELELSAAPATPEA